MGTEVEARPGLAPRDTAEPRTEPASPDATACPRLAVLVPCHNEAAAIASVVRQFRLALPDAAIFVYDNNSSDGTREEARAAGALVRREPLQGKGNVVRRMFADVEADAYVLVDGDATYDAASAPLMVKMMFDDHLDMVSGRRVTEDKDAYRRGHRFGNALLTRMVAIIFGDRFGDMLTGYRVLSRRYVKSFPALASGFEIEAELTIHALELRMPTAELDTVYLPRPDGSASKLRTYRDGLRILGMILLLVKEERPLPFFAAIFAALAATATGLSIPLLLTYLQTGLVPRFPTAILAASLMLLAFLGLACGLILDTVTLGRREAKRMCYLQIPAP